MGCVRRSTCPNIYRFSAYYGHPLYVPNVVQFVGLANDISLIKLATPFTASTYPSAIRPVCLPMLPPPPWGTSGVVVSGWGRDRSGSSTNDLKWAYLKTVPMPVCLAYFQMFYPSYICAAPITGATCNGDSGSAAVAQPLFGGGPFHIDGVVSFGGFLGCSQLPISFKGFTNVWLFKNWINWVIQNF